MSYMDTLRKVSGLDVTEFPNYDTPEMVLDVPYFINENPYRKQAREWREHNEQARIGAAVGAVKKENRQAERAERRRKHSNIEFAVLAAIMTVLMLLVGAVESGMIQF